MKNKEPQDDDQILAVREKASHRKGRTGNVVRSARIPTQERSKKRYHAILDATIKLLERTNIEDISLHDIAKACGLPAPSVHYLFSTMSAVHLELSNRFNEEMTQRVVDYMRSASASRVNTWQDLARLTLVYAREQYNGNRALSEVLLAPVMHRSVRAISFQTNTFYGRSSLELFNELFVMPDIPNLDTYFVFSTEMMEGMWTGAYARYGKIDDLTFEESVRASIAYLRCYLPETLARRS